MVRRALLLGWIAGLAVGCTGGSADGKDDTADTEEDTGGGGTGDLWRASGSGVAYFLDGSGDNSLFHMELTRCTPPAEGEAYYGWVSRGGEDAIALGEITVTNEEVYFEADIGENAIIGGYDTFEAWATDNGGTAREGTLLWQGQVDAVVYDVIQNLLISSDATPDGQGSLRSVESAVQALRNAGQEVVDAGFVQSEFQAAGEAIANGLEGTSEDHNDDGTVSTLPDQLGVLSDGGYIDLILSDLDAATLQVDPGNPIKDYINYAYDCTQAIETHARYAAVSADVVSICLSEDSCESRMLDALTELGYALDGQDLNEDGTIDLLTEGTIECALSYVSEMVQMAVSTP
jgi:hypothetical protein